jgi:hypothetical protein
MPRRTTDYAIVVSREPKPRDGIQEEVVALRLTAARLRRELAVEQKAHQATLMRLMRVERKYRELMISARQRPPKGVGRG